MHITKNFTKNELECPCCSRCNMDPTFMEVLQQVRYDVDRPFKINSGYRCQAHNTLVSNSPKSRHIYGMAVDISIANWSGKEIYSLLFHLTNVGPRKGYGTGLGVYPKHIHFDIRDTYNTCWIEVYK